MAAAAAKGAATDKKVAAKTAPKAAPKTTPKTATAAPVSLSSKRAFSLVIAALGGEGGGVLADWVTTAARKEGWISQSTSVPGVAQRTGATIYYVELFAADEADKPPVMALFPMAGDVDVVLASEALEAARMVKQGLVTGDCTTLIASDSRAYMVNEKMAAGDGIADQELLVESARKASKQFIHFDMQEQTQRHGTIISATMLGALAGSGALPFKRASWESAIRDSGSRGVEASLASFAESYQRVSKPETDSKPQEPAITFLLPEGKTPGGEALLGRIRQEFPAPLQQVLYHAIVRLADYQDHAYADSYLDRVKEVLALDKGDPEHALTRETARFLALWMAFEDIARVAQLKIRGARTEQIRAEVRATDEQPIRVNEYLRPQVRELVSFLPPWLARLILRSKACNSFLRLFTGGRVVRTSTVFGFSLFFLMSLLRLLRRRSWVFQEETGRIEEWLAGVRQTAARDPKLGLQVALCGQLIKGYSDTRERGFVQMRLILERVAQAQTSAGQVVELRQAALADDTGEALQACLNAGGGSSGDSASDKAKDGGQTS